MVGLPMLLAFKVKGYGVIGVNVVKLFWHNYAAIGIKSVKIIEKYAANGINYMRKSFIILVKDQLIAVIYIFQNHFDYLILSID
jgi:hypothetical protein